MRLAILANGILILSTTVSAQEPTESQPQSPVPSTFGLLFEAEGVAETFAFCTGCHSEQIVAQQGLKRADWDDLFDYMEDEHGMAPIPEPYRTQILDYLSTYYGPDRPHFPK